MFYIKNSCGQFWTGECWGLREARRYYLLEELIDLELDNDCKPPNFFDHVIGDIGWGLPDGTVFARAELEKCFD